MKMSNYILLSLSINILIYEYIYKSNITYYIYDKKYSKVYKEKYSKIYDDKYSSLYKEKYEKDNNNNNIRLNKCVKNKIPKISGLLETAQYIRYSNNSIVRFGDGEIRLMEMTDIPLQKADEVLSKRLREIFNSNLNNLSIAILNIVNNCYSLSEGQSIYYFKNKRYERYILNNANYSKQYFDAHITSSFTVTYETSCELIYKIYEELREIWRDKRIVIMRGDNGENYEYDVYDTAKEQKIYYAKSKEAWPYYEEYKELLMKEDKESIFILAIGSSSKILVYDLVKEGRRALDMGHLAKDYNCFMKGKFDRYFY